jgi:hypothetical protein
MHATEVGVSSAVVVSVNRNKHCLREGPQRLQGLNGFCSNAAVGLGSNYEPPTMNGRGPALDVAIFSDSFTSDCQ